MVVTVGVGTGLEALLRNIDFTTDDGLDPLRFGGIVELYGAEEIAKAGATAIIQPGGSVRDKEVIDAANRLGLAMVFTGVRHFRH